MEWGNALGSPARSLDIMESSHLLVFLVVSTLRLIVVLK